MVSPIQKFFLVIWIIFSFSPLFSQQFPVPDLAFTFDDTISSYNSLVRDVAGHENHGYWDNYWHGDSTMYAGYRPYQGKFGGAWYMSGYHVCCEDMGSSSMDFILLAPTVDHTWEYPLFHEGFNSFTVAFWFKSDRDYNDSTHISCPPEPNGMHEQEILFSMGCINGLTIKNDKGYYSVKIRLIQYFTWEEIEKEIRSIFNGTNRVEKDWQHIAITFDGTNNGQLMVYLDGKPGIPAFPDLNPIYTGFDSVPHDTLSVKLGALNGPGLYGDFGYEKWQNFHVGSNCVTAADVGKFRTGWPANGYFDEFVFYKNKALSEEEIDSLAKYGLNVLLGLNPELIVLPEIKHSCPGQSGGSVYLTVPSGLPPYFYLWSTGDTTESVSGLSPGEYWFNVTDSLGSLNTDTIQILEAELPYVEITQSSNTSYYGFADGMAFSEASRGTVPYSYQWDDPENTLDSLVQNLRGNETYHVTVTDANGCFSVDSVKIPESDELYVDISLISGLVCQGDSNGTASAVPWYAEPPLDIVWDDPAGTTDSVVTNLYPGRYFHVNVTDAKGKTGSDSIFFSKPEPIVLNSLLITNVHTCYGFENGSVTITANMEQDPLLYSVDGGNTFQEDGYFSDLGAGEYSLVIKDTNDCILEIDSIVISQPEKVRTGMIAGYKNVTEGDITFYSVTQKSGSVFNWMVEGGNLIAGQGSNFINVQWGSGLSGTVSVVETDATECVGDTVRVEVSIKGLSIQEDKKGNDRINVYPNPFHENTIIRFPNPEHREYKMAVIDFAGRVVMNSGEITGEEYELNKGGLYPGFYLVEIRGERIFRMKIIIQ